MNQEKLHRYILPGEKVTKRPTGFPSLPVQSEQELHALEKFLANDTNLSAASMYLGRFMDKNSLDNSVRKFLRNVLSNDVANKFSFQGAKGKQKFEVLKTWELVLGEQKYTPSWQATLTW
ncbi:PREDICTED: uncharacterized protein LOC105556180 [Vollenhovia emeryi]|uniref:uncharacterized protein LOC105556180 n=1 Tax=Vollenhovia emeryi TaxID=411798 RepID=UPI0005F545F6|nr:PREDICTED: uncharacterized protein LOC105556180 [Vollenhovia emeryi]